MVSMFAPKLPIGEIAQLVEATKQHILAYCYPLSIRLFGSAARDSMSQASDIDVAVILADQDDIREAIRAVCCAKRSFL